MWCLVEKLTEYTKSGKKFKIEILFWRVVIWVMSGGRSIVVMEDIFCIFSGALDNICDLRKYYGLSRQATEAMIMVEAYKVLRDRAPYPPDQVIKELEGKFSFILFDSKTSTLFLARVIHHITPSAHFYCFFITFLLLPNVVISSFNGLYLFEHSQQSSFLSDFLLFK